MKTSVISKEFRDRYLGQSPRIPNAFEGRAIVFEGPEDYHHRIDDPALDIDEHCILFVRGKPVRSAIPAAPRVVEHASRQPPSSSAASCPCPCIGDGRQSGTSGSPVDPERHTRGRGPTAAFAILKTGDMVRVDLKQRPAPTS